MAEKDTTREFHDELLSAYLDGELSPAERTRVEERLAVDPVARQTLDELRSVSQALQGLPRKQLGEDLRSAILRRAEQETLATAKQPATQPASEAASSVSTIGPPQLTFGRTRRGWVWAAMAVAAALVIMFLERDPKQDGKLGDVAVHDARPAKPENSGPAFNAAPNRVLKEDSFAEKDDEASKSQSGDKLAIDGMTRPAPTQPGSSSESGSGATKMRQELVVEQLATKESQSDSDVNSRDKLAAGKQTVDDFGDRARKSGEGQPATRPMLGFDESQSAQLKNERGTSELSATGGPPETYAMGGARLDGGIVNARGVPSEPSAQATTNTPAPAKREDVLVVYVDVKRESLRSRAIDRQLVANGISLDVAAAAAGSDSGSNRVGKLSDAFATYDYFNSDFTEPLGINVSGPTDPANTDAILVDAPPAEVTGLLAALDADSDNVLSISIDGRELAGDAAQANKLAGVDWSKLKRANLSEEMHRFKQLADERNTGLATTMDTSAAGQQGASFGGGRGRAGGGAGGRGGRGGGRGARRGGAAPNGDAVAMPRGGGGGGGPAQNASQLGGEQPSAKDATGASVSGGSEPDRQVAAQQQSGGRSYGLEGAVTNAEPKLEQSARAAAAEGVRTDGSTELKQMRGRARRIVVAPQSQLRELARTGEASEQFFKRHIAEDKNAPTPASEKQADAAMPVASTAAGVDASGKRANEARGADNQPSVMNRFGMSGNASSSEAEQAAAGQIRGGSSSRDLNTATAPAANATADQLSKAPERAGGPATADQLGRTGSLRVLFVLRAQPESAATPADTTARPTTSLPATDPAK